MIEIAFIAVIIGVFTVMGISECSGGNERKIALDVCQKNLKTCEEQKYKIIFDSMACCKQNAEKEKP
jgi:hypothetical protein